MNCTFQCLTNIFTFYLLIDGLITIVVYVMLAYQIYQYLTLFSILFYPVTTIWAPEIVQYFI